MEKYFSKPILQPVAKVDLDADLSGFKSERTPLPPICGGKPISQVYQLNRADLSVLKMKRALIPPINAKVQAQEALHLETPYEETTWQSSMSPNITPEPQLVAAWRSHDIFTQVPNKSRKIIKRTLKEKHISKRCMCEMVQQTVEWVQMLCMDVVLPAVLLCLIEEYCMIKEAQFHQKRAGECKQMKSDEILNSSTEEARRIGVNIFQWMMDCMHGKNASVVLDAEWTASGLMTSGNSISRETIHMFTTELMACVYQKLLANDMGKAYPLEYLCSDVTENDTQTQTSSRWEFYWSVLHNFFQQAAKNHVGLFLGLPDILLQGHTEGSTNMEKISKAYGMETMTNGERTSLNVLTEVVTDIGMDYISDVIRDPLCTSEIVKQGEKSLAQYFSVATSHCDEPEQSEVWGSSPKPATPEPEYMFSPSPEIYAESLDTAEDVELKDIQGKTSSPTDSLLDLDEELEGLSRSSLEPATPEPTKVFSSSAKIQAEPLKSYKVELKNLPGESSSPTNSLLDLDDSLDQELKDLLRSSTEPATPEPTKVFSSSAKMKKEPLKSNKDAKLKNLPGESSAPTHKLLNLVDLVDQELDELEGLGCSPKHGTPEPKIVLSTSAKIKAELLKSDEDAKLKNLSGKFSSPTNSLLDLDDLLDEELEELLRSSSEPATPEPMKVFSSSAKMKKQPLKSNKDTKLKKFNGRSSSPADSLLDLDDLLDEELDDLLRSLTEPATPEPTKVFSSSAKIQAEPPESKEDIEVKPSAPTVSPLQLEDSLYQSRAPTGKRCQKLKKKRKGPVSKVQTEKQHCEETLKEETSFRAAELPTKKITQGFVLPQHFIESVIDGLLTKLQSTYNINVPGFYLCDVLFNKLVQELANLARVHVVTNILMLQPFPDEDKIVLQIVNEAHDIVKDKSYLRAAWQDHEMAVNYLTTVVSAVILDYTVLGGRKQKNDQTYTTFKEKCHFFMSRMRQSLLKAFCFK